MKEKIKVGDTVYFETLTNNIDSMVISRIEGNKLFDSECSFIMKEDVINKSNPKVILYKKLHPINESTTFTSDSSINIELVDKVISWLNAQSGRVITKKLINEFSNYINYDRY